MNTFFSLLRYQFIRDYTLKSLRLKIDKWNKLWSSDDARNFLQQFVETDWHSELVLSQTAGGQIQAHLDWPTPLHHKAEYQNISPVIDVNLHIMC